MKVVQILPELVSGGVERGTLEISKALIKAGHTSIVISNGGSLVKKLEDEGGKHISMPVHKKSLSSLSQIRPLRALLKAENVDIIHARSRVPAWISYLAWNKMDHASRPRFMTTFHGFHSVSPYSEIMTKGERVIAVSDSIKTHIKECYPKADLNKVSVIHRGVSDEEYYFSYKAPHDSEAVNLKRKYEGKFILTLPGRITGWKGGKDFIHIIAELKQRGIPVVGWFAGGVHAKRGGFYEELKELIHTMKLEEHVFFLGERKDLKDIMSVSDVVLSLSTKAEAFGRVSLEALRLGIPVVGYAHGGVDEQLSVLFPEGAVLLNDREACVNLLEKWASKRPSIVEQENPFSLKIMQESVLKIYSELHAG